jgi:endonuclease III
MTGERGKRLARRMLSCLRKAYGHPKATVRRSPLEELLIGIVADGISERRAGAAIQRLMDEFVDWNEVRVGTAADIGGKLPDVRNPAGTGEHIRRILERIAARSNDLVLDFLGETSPESAAALVNGIPGFPESALSRVTVLIFKHDACPPTSEVVALCRRVGLLGDGDGAAMTAQFRKLLPKASMYEFHALAYCHAAGVCRDHQPVCAECVLRFDCRSAAASEAAAQKARARKNASSARSARPKAKRQSARTVSTTRAKSSPKAKAKRAPSRTTRGISSGKKKAKR